MLAAAEPFGRAHLWCRTKLVVRLACEATKKRPCYLCLAPRRVLGGDGAVCMEVPLCDTPPSSAVRSGFLRTSFLCFFFVCFLGRVRLHSCLTLSKCFPRGPSAAVVWCVVKTCHPKSSAKTSLVYSKRSLSPSRAGWLPRLNTVNLALKTDILSNSTAAHLQEKASSSPFFFFFLFSRDVTW